MSFQDYLIIFISLIVTVNAQSYSYSDWNYLISYAEVDWANASYGCGLIQGRLLIIDPMEAYYKTDYLIDRLIESQN